MSEDHVRRTLRRVSPAGRLEVHLANLAGLEKNAGGLPEDFDFSRYRKFVEVSADRVERGLSGEALQYLAHADAALAHLELEWDGDRIRGVKQRGNQYHPTGPTPRTAAILQFMRELVTKGLSPAAAAKIAAAKKVGTSEVANHKAWKRWAKKTGD